VLGSVRLDVDVKRAGIQSRPRPKQVLLNGTVGNLEVAGIVILASAGWIYYMPTGRKNVVKITNTKKRRRKDVKNKLLS